jgi:DNA ligase (NAD+)
MIDSPAIVRMKELVDELNESSRKYYSGGEEDDEPPMTDACYDRKLSELMFLEQETGVKLPNTPTIRVGFEEAVEGKVKHYSPVLSLKDTKSIDDLLHFLGENEGILSWKLDGISIVLYYANGNLVRALSRGDGLWGKDITKNVMLMRNVPKTISTKSNLIIRGEGCLSLREFEQIKRTKEGEGYRNPRNLAAGLINGTRTTNTLLRHMSFIAHSVILMEGIGGNIKTLCEQFLYLQTLGFRVVPHHKVQNYTLKRIIEDCSESVKYFEYPTDGLVLALDDLEYGKSLGTTAKYPKHSMAFKWPDVMVLTHVIGMKWSVSQTGLITPVALLEPVELEGTTVKQANLHTLKGFFDLGIGVGDTVRVYKANKIIPEIDENLTRSGTEAYPLSCPKCGGGTKVIASEKTIKLYCTSCQK